jgi:hypothetical protein
MNDVGPSQAASLKDLAKCLRCVHTREIATARLYMIMRRAEIAESRLEKERELSGSRFVSVRMPELGDGITEGTVKRWLKGEGEHFGSDELLVEMATPLGVTTLALQGSGTVRDITVAEEETVAAC